ncbi:MAG: formylglycine-generating enzyme family protein [Candidatus Omnitrophica bacterium]|nr:formylglycine-generating enzyme family protein [Candidatus Omnitrophota bacterium]
MKTAMLNIAVIAILFAIATAAVKERKPSREKEENLTVSSPAKTITIELSKLKDGAKKLEMVLIPAGSFIMGSPEEETGRSKNDWPLHYAAISRPFYMSQYEITQAQWEAVVGRHVSKFKGKPDHPVEKVRWTACMGFIRRLNQLGQGTFRFPTEAEWEYACRAGTKTRFFFGDSLDEADEYMWWSGDNDDMETHIVGVKRPNSWGLYDMHGNVSEWTSDRWVPACDRGEQTDPEIQAKGWSSISPWTNRVFRGGCFFSPAEDCRSANRMKEQQIDFHYSLGFRLVRECS